MMMFGYKRRAAFVAALASVLAAALIFVPTASAAQFDDGDWYITTTGVSDAWGQGITGKGVKVAVLDSQIVSDYPAIAGKGVASKLVLRDGASSCKSTDGTRTMRVSNPSLRTGEEGLYMTHGTEMTAYIVGDGSGYDGNRGLMGVAQDAQATHYPMTFGVANLFGLQTACEVNGSVIGFGDTVRAAVADGNRVINMSWHSEDNDETVEALVEAMRAGVLIVSAAGNNTKDSGLRDYVGEPTKTNRFPGLLAVNMVDASGMTTRRDGGVTLLAPSDDINGYARGDARNTSVTSGGSSAASAITSGMLALVMDRWPEATGNQVLQSVVRHTQGNTSGEPVFDEDLRAGFGVVDLPKLLAVDPSQYPDINPLLEAAVVNSEKHEETKGMYTDRSGWGDHQIANTQVFDLDGSSHIDVQREASLVGEEYERQKAAWAKVERCRADGGTDCMQYSATNTALAETSSETSVAGDASSVGTQGAVTSNAFWYWIAGAFGVVTSIGCIAFAVVLYRRQRKRG